jgi:hypothetical protein
VYAIALGTGTGTGERIGSSAFGTHLVAAWISERDACAGPGTDLRWRRGRALAACRRSPELLVEAVGRADEGQVRERLREVAESFAGQADLLRIEA